MTLSEAINQCSIEGCGNKVLARGWCNAHWKRWSRYGDPLISRHASPGEPLKWLLEVAVPYEGDDCLTWPFGASEGYGVIHLPSDGGKEYAHRHVCRIAHGDPSNERDDAAHSCGKGHEGCVSPKHLSWKSRAANLDDKIEHGTHNRGEQNYAAKLSEDGVRA